jgi:hypothetical protein
MACHTTATELDSMFALNYTGAEPETVMAVDTFDLNWEPGHWGTLAFSHPFAYDGNRNLLLEIRWTGDYPDSTVFVGHWLTPVSRSVFAGSATAESGNLWPWCAWLRLLYDPTAVVEPGSPLPAPPALQARLSPDGARLSFDNPSPGPVRIRVFDLAGQLRFSRSGLMAAGTRTIDLDLPTSGVYFLMVEAAGRRVAAKSVVFR